MFVKLFRGKGEEAKFELTSMIDVVFLLLIFFMCAAKFKQIERRLDAFLPSCGPGDGPVETEELMIFVMDDVTVRNSADANLRAMRRGTYYLASREAQPVADPADLYPILQRLAVANSGQRVVIAPYDEAQRQDQRVPFFNIVSVLDVCKVAGVHNVGFQAPTER